MVEIIAFSMIFLTFIIGWIAIKRVINNDSISEPKGDYSHELQPYSAILK